MNDIPLEFHKMSYEFTIPIHNLKIPRIGLGGAGVRAIITITPLF